MVLLVPLGSCEQHGPHLPLGTDTVIAVAAATALAERVRGTVVSPPVSIGASGEHAGFPGTLSIGTDALAAVLVELARSADSFVATVFVNAHGGNGDALRRAVSVLRSEGRNVAELRCGFTDGDAHAGRTETSLLLWLAPEHVRLDRARRGAVRPWVELDAEIRRAGVIAVSKNGVIGDPTGASAAEGERLFVDLVDRLSDRLAAHVATWSAGIGSS